MNITAEQWSRYEASNSKKRKRSSILRAIHKHVCDVRKERSERKSIENPLPATQRLQEIRLGREREAKWDAELKRARNAEKLAREIRETLLSAARVARSMGFDVRKSTSRSGNVRSYYARRDSKITVRISDHELPMTDHREMMSNMHGGGSPFIGEIIIDESMSKTRLRRLLVLAEGGRL